MNEPAWKESLPKPPEGAVLREAWFTTFDPPDSGLLVEHLLPSLLGVGSSLVQDMGQRSLFFGELDRALKYLRARLTIISSPQRTAQELPRYPWIWRYASHFTVGEKKRAVQHSKLWAFHWEKKDGDGEWLELHVSSTNLTESAFKAQLQAGWNCCVRLDGRPTKARQQGWGELVLFLEALGASAGEKAKERTGRLVALLARASCPQDVSFVASVPGDDRRAAQAIKKLKPSAIHVLTPTIGDWTPALLKDWCKDAGVSSSQVHLKWIDVGHPWSRKEGWALTERTREALKDADVRIDELPPDFQLHDKHANGDPRWSHAKLYLLRLPNKRKRRLLVTSANWSTSAWGAGRAKARNFELGVLFETDWKELEKSTTLLESPFCLDREQEPDPNSRLRWAEASWDGRRIDLHARSSDRSSPINAVVKFTDNTERSIRLRSGNDSMKWENPEITPFAACFKQGGETLEINILDLRSPNEFARTPLPEVDPDKEQALREALLLQTYGGPAVDAESIFRQGGEIQPTSGTAPAADYTVAAWLEAREAFRVIDRWRAALKNAEEKTGLIEQIRMDGEGLFAIYKRRSEAAAQLAAEELGWHLEGGKP